MRSAIPSQNFRSTEAGAYLGNLFAEHLAKALRGVVVGREADNGELFGKKIVLSEIANRGEQFAFGQVASRAEDNHHTRRGGGIRIWVVGIIAGTPAFGSQTSWVIF